MLSIRQLTIAVLTLTAIITITSAQPAQASMRARREAAKVAAASAVAANAALNGDPSCCAPAPVCAPVCRQPNICYRDRTRCCDPCAPKMETVLSVCDPCTGCPVAVPVCLPACCTDCPEVCGRNALFGHGVVTYRWCNGFTATVRFDRCGDVLVTYRS